MIVFALPSIFILPFLTSRLGLGQPVAGAWIGGNIDTTAAVTAAGTLAGEQALQIASIVKVTQRTSLPSPRSGRSPIRTHHVAPSGLVESPCIERCPPGSCPVQRRETA